MIKNAIFGASIIALTATSPALAQDADVETSADASAPAPAKEAAPVATIDYGEWGVGLDLLDASVDPGDDFNAYVNGKWIAETEIPADRSSFGAAHILIEKSTKDIEVLIADLVKNNPAAGTTERRIVDAYNAFNDTDAIDATGLAPAHPFLTEIFTAPDVARLAELFQTPGYPALISVGVTVDSKNPDSYIPTVGFGGMGLPDRDYYLIDSERNLEVRAEYMKFLSLFLEQAGYADPAAAADAIYAFEYKVAELEWARQVMRNPELTYNSLSADELQALSPTFPIKSVLETGGFGAQPQFLARQIPPTEGEVEELGLSEEQLGMIGGGLPAMMELINSTDLATLKAWMAVRFLSGYSPYLHSDLDAANFAFSGTVLNGQEQQRPRWKRSIGVVGSQLGEQLAALYVARYFPPEAKSRMEALVANLKLSMAKSLDEVQWMSPATVEQASAKLGTMSVQVGYPDEFEAYEGLEISGDSPLGNAISTTKWSQADSLSQLGEPVDKNEWLLLPQTVNAYYAPNFNQIVFPAAFLNPPFFNMEADPAVNYGAIGSVIGHEIGHGFDDQGSKYDSQGALRNWWQAEDREGFEDRAAQMAKLIEAYCPIDDGEDGKLCLKGDLSMGETLGDVVGLQMAYRAYRMSLNGEEAPVIDGLTGDQRFFLGFGQNWRSKLREENLRNRLLTAVHPPSEFRLNNAVRHLDAWYDAFDVGPDNVMYLAPEDRVKIWE
ncbi:MAG: M13 family metallopeptidase [Erythrobacter sp.]